MRRWLQEGRPNKRTFVWGKRWNVKKPGRGRGRGASCRRRCCRPPHHPIVPALHLDTFPARHLHSAPALHLDTFLAFHLHTVPVLHLDTTRALPRYATPRRRRRRHHRCLAFTCHLPSHPLRRMRPSSPPRESSVLDRVVRRTRRVRRAMFVGSRRRSLSGWL